MIPNERGGKLKNQIMMGKPEHLEGCYRILMDSELGKVYFSNKSPYKAISRALENEEIHVALSEENKCIGFIWYRINGTFDKYPYLHMIVVDKKFQSKGIGKTLIYYFENVITVNYDKVFLMVGVLNERARRLYEKLNYKVVGAFSDFYIDGVEEYLMMKVK